MGGNYQCLDTELIKNALESDSEVTLDNSNVLILSNISSEKDFEQAIEDVEKQIEKEDTNDVVYTYTKESDQEVDDNKYPLTASLDIVNGSAFIDTNNRDTELQIDKSILYNVEQLFPEEDAYRNCNYLKTSIQTLVNFENKINATDYTHYYYQDIQHITQSIPFVKKSYDTQLPAEITCIATNSSKIYLGTASGEIICNPLDSFQPPQSFTEKLYTPSSPSAAITCICISRDSKWLLTGHQNGVIQLLQLGMAEKQEQRLIQGLSFLRGINESQTKKPGTEYLNSVASTSFPKIPLNIECLNKTNWDLFISICKGFTTTEYSLCIFSITTTVLSYKLTMVESLPFHNLSLIFQPGMVSTEIDLEIITLADNKKPTTHTSNDNDKRQKDTFNFSIFQPGFVHMMSYSKNKSINLVNTITINRTAKYTTNECYSGDFQQNTSIFDGESRGVWLRSASTFQSVLFVIDLNKIYLISPSGNIITYNKVSQFNIPNEIISLKRLSLSIVVALDLKGSIHFFQVLGHNDKLTIVKFGGSSDCIVDLQEFATNASIPLVCCCVSEMNVEEKGCKKFVATVNSIANSANITRKTIPIDSFLCKFGHVCVFYSGKLHLFVISSWYNILCKLAFNKKFSKSLRLLSGIYQNKLPRLLEFQSNRYQLDAQKLLLYILHQSCAQAVKMKKELGITELFISDLRLEPLKSLCNILIESCMSTNMYNELVGLLFRSFNGISLSNLFISQFLDTLIKYTVHGCTPPCFNDPNSDKPHKSQNLHGDISEEPHKISGINTRDDDMQPFTLGLPLTEAIVALIRNSLNELNTGEMLEPNSTFINPNNTSFMCKNPTDSMLRYYFILKLLRNISDFALNDPTLPISLESEPLQNLAIEFELWDILVKLKMKDLTCDSLVYLFDTLALQLVKIRESTFEKHYTATFHKLKKALLQLIPPPRLYKNNCLANTFVSLWSVTDYTTYNSCVTEDEVGYFANATYKDTFINSLRVILIMSFGSENVTDHITYTENTLLHPVLTEAILLAPGDWFEFSIHNDKYHPVLKSHYNSYNLETDKLSDPEVIAYKIVYYENAYKLYALSFMIYHVMGNNLDHSFDKWDDLLHIYQSPIMLYNDNIRSNCESFNIVNHHYFGNCPIHQLEKLTPDYMKYNDENVLYDTRNERISFGNFFILHNFDITYPCKCYHGYLLSLLGLMVKQLIPFPSPPDQLFTISKLPLQLTIEDKSIIFEALSMFDDIFKLLDRDNLTNFLLHHFSFVEIDDTTDEPEITSPRQLHHLLTWSVIKNIQILKELNTQVVRRVLFYTLSNESMKLMINMGVLTNIPDMADTLLDSLHDYPELQADVYILLMKNLKDKLGKFDRFDHLLELLCQRKCKRLIPLLKKEPKIDIKKCLSVASDKYPFPEVKSYLMERAGNIQASLDGVDDFDEMVEITIRAIGKISDHSLLLKWIDLLTNHPKTIPNDNKNPYCNYVISKISKSLAKLSGYGLDIAEHPDLIGRYIRYLEKYPDKLDSDTNNYVIELFRKILRSLDMKRGVFIEALQLARQSLDIEVAKRMESLSRGILVGKNNEFDKTSHLPFSNICGGCNRTLKVDDQMRIFLCGHVFHSQCKPEIACNLH